jgi:nucleoside-diphosphate-sugar epimerase
VDERHPVHPIDFNGVHKQAASQYHLLMTRMGKLDAVVLNLTNIYGPRIALDVPGQGFLAQYVAQALRGNGLKIFGDGSQTRDPLYVEDAVEAILLAGLASLSEHRVFNVGHAEVWALRDIALLVSEIAGLPAPEFVPFPENRRAIDIGSYATDTRLTHSVLGWQATTRLPEGIRMTLHHYCGRAGASGGSSVAEVAPQQTGSLCQSA